MTLLAEGGILTQFVCDNTDCLSYIITFLDILTVLYLAYCASFRVNRGVRIFGWVWAAIVIAATITIVALHTCMFTLVSAFFTALVLMALFGVTFEAIAEKQNSVKASGEKDDAPVSEKPATETPATPFVCPLAAFACPMAKGIACVPAQEQAPAPVEQAETVEETPAAEEAVVVEETPAPVEQVVEEPVVSTEAAETEVAVSQEEPLTLSETLAIAKETKKAQDVINKKYVADFLKETFNSSVECNMRDNFTKTNLPLADTHYALSKTDRKCFVYVYETGSAVALLLHVSDAYAKSVRAGGHKISRSAFPKAKNSWYSVIVDDTYTEDDIKKILTDACNMAK